jgi:alkylhydroperoxidase family enzyme
LLRLTHNQRLVEELSSDFHRAEDLEPRDREMLGYVARLAKEPWAMTSEHLDRLRHTGFSDRAILEINLVASYMSFVNRVAQGLGVELEDYFRHFTR